MNYSVPLLIYLSAITAMGGLKFPPQMTAHNISRTFSKWQVAYVGATL